MENNTMPKRILKGRIYFKRSKGRPRMRWLDDVERDLKKKVRGWKEKMRNREQWRLVVEEAKAHPGLYRRRRREFWCDIQETNFPNLSLLLTHQEWVDEISENDIFN
jgi:hypothetical protein